MLLLRNRETLFLLLLDIDGTMVQKGRLVSNLKLAATVAGFDPWAVDVFFDEVYRGVRPFLNNLREGAKVLWGVDSGFRFERFKKAFHELEISMPYDPVEGAAEKIDWVQSHGVKVGFLSANGREASHKKVSYGGLNPRDFFFATADDRFVKPDPRAFQDVLAEFGVGGEHTLLMGDSGADYHVTRIKFEEREVVLGNFCGVLSGVCGEEAFLKLGVERHRLLPSVAHLPAFLETA